MVITISILISLVISLGISIYFSKINKDNNSMEKVRNYANKRQEDLLNLYKEIQGKFNTLISEFNAQQTQANAAIKMLKVQNADFAEKMQTFSQSIASVQDIKSQIDNYAQVLKDISGAASVDTAPLF